MLGSSTFALIGPKLLGVEAARVLGPASLPPTANNLENIDVSAIETSSLAALASCLPAVVTNFCVKTVGMGSIVTLS